MIKISVIIPVYNVEKYLAQCLDSVINQTYKNLEIICVDDCSTDNSRQILKEYAEKDERIKILYNEKNSKLGPTRNNGYKVATGDYIHFLDSDDWLELDAYEKLVKIIENNNLDVVYFYLQEVSEIDGLKKKYLPQKPENLNKYITIDDEFRKDIECLEQVWNKLYSKKFLDEFNILHNDYECHEDMEFTLLIRIYARTIYYLDEILINYRVNRNYSLMQNKFKYTNCVLQSYLNAEKWCQEKISWSVGKYILKNAFILLQAHVFAAYNLHKALTYKELANIFKQINYDLIKDTVWHVEIQRCKEISTNPQCYYEFKTFLRQFTKEKFPVLHKFLKELRNRFII